MSSRPAPIKICAPSVAEVREICRIDNALLRNLRITDCYHRLSSAFAARVGSGANWCTFATWASRQAGCTIRGEDMIGRIGPETPRLWRALLRAGLLDPRTAAGWIVRNVHTPFDAVERASSSVAAGNLKVFEEIGEVFARSLEDSDFEPEQPLLREAFADYGQAMVESDLDKRSQLMLFGNLKCGWHEQTRLQPEIVSAMKAPLAMVNDLTRRFAPFLRRPVERFTGLLQELTCRIVTRGFMSLRLPDGARLELGRDLGRQIPACFNGIDRDPLLMQFENAGCGGEGAEDWSNLEQRMRYISRLFRCFHHEAGFLRPPFDESQRAAILAGRLPRGVL
jgi:hypothetical protein